MKKNLFKFTKVSAVVILCVVFGTQQLLSESVIAEEEATVIKEKVLKIYNEVNLDLIEEIFDPEFVLHTSAFPQDLVGHEGLKKYIQMNHSQFSDFQLVFDEVIVKDNDIVTRWTVTGKNTGPMQTPFGEIPPTGKEFRIHGLSLSKLVDGKIKEEWIVYNILDMMLQLGFSLQPPGEKE